MVMRAFTASKVEYIPERAKTTFGPYLLVDGQKFKNCEIYPYHVDIPPVNEEEKVRNRTGLFKIPN